MHVANQISSSISYRSFYAPVSRELETVESFLHDFLICDNPFIGKVVHHGFQLGGKRLRPALLLLFAKMGGEVTEKQLTLAAAVETIHAATLVHDDILDEAKIRRHLPTVNAIWNNETSVLLGDYMVARAMQRVTELDDTRVSRIVARTSCELCEGEMRQVGFRGRFDLTEEQYNRIIRGKTASLCECACYLGTFLSDRAFPEQLIAAGGYGLHLGMAFQIADDLLDLAGDEGKMGKTLGTDLEKQKITLPLIRLFAKMEEAERAALVEKIQNDSGAETRREVQELLKSHGILEEVRQTAMEHLNKAITLLDAFPESPSRQSLRDLARFVIERQI
ncbi:MAG: polyprenyl synthetase family protein [Planctomycetia bacterium]|nr:polyprenyl synthetase family protein [Planctomycetia bacterium]